MKITVLAIALMASALSQASALKCFSLEEGFTPALQVNVSEVIDSADVWGYTYELSSATVLEKGEVVGTFNAGGFKEIPSNYTLSLDGVEVGSLVAQPTGVENRLSGTFTLKGVVTEIGCESSR